MLLNGCSFWVMSMIFSWSIWIFVIAQKIGSILPPMLVLVLVIAWVAVKFGIHTMSVALKMWSRVKFLFKCNKSGIYPNSLLFPVNTILDDCTYLTFSSAAMQLLTLPMKFAKHTSFTPNFTAISGWYHTSYLCIISFHDYSIVIVTEKLASTLWNPCTLCIPHFQAYMNTQSND